MQVVTLLSTINICTNLAQIEWDQRQPEQEELPSQPARAVSAFESGGIWDVPSVLINP